MIRLNRLATTLRTLSTTTVRTFSTTRCHSLIKTVTASHNTKSISGSYNTAGITFVGRNFSYSTARRLKKVPVCDNRRKYVPNDVVLHQLEADPVCNKVKVFLEYYGIPHKIVEVDPHSDFRKQKLGIWFLMQQVRENNSLPVLMVDGEKMVNASGIIDEMFKRMHPDSVPVDSVTQKWRGWVDTTLLPVLIMNTYGSLSGALEVSDYMWSHGCYEDSERFVLKHSHAWFMYLMVNKVKIKHYFRLKKKWKGYKVNNDREFLYKTAEEWVDALKGRQYLGGTEPNLGDLAVFGVLRPVRYLEVGKDLVANTRIGEWFMRMEKEMKTDCIKSRNWSRVEN